MDDIGEVMRKLRSSFNYNQNYVAEKVGVDVTTYSRYERGETEPRIETIVKVSDLYKITVDQLLHYNDESFKVNEPSASYIKRWSVPVTVALDGTEDTLNMWMKKLTAINAAL